MNEHSNLRVFIYALIIIVSEFHRNFLEWSEDIFGLAVPAKLSLREIEAGDIFG